MQKILRKRILRNLKSNIVRYLALGFLIILSMYMVISMTGAAETVIQGVDKKAAENKLEDGEFTVFVPLTDEQKEKVTDKGITLEDEFYFDFNMSDSSTVRVFKSRNDVNLVDIEKGNAAENDNEAVVEKRYAEKHSISIGDTITVGDKSLKVTGIGTVPDYDAPYKSLSDTSIDSNEFGLVFVNESQYKTLKDSKKSSKAEQYVYCYRLNDKISDKELKNIIKEIKYSPDAVNDSYFKDYYKRTAGKKDDIKDGINDLYDGSQKLTDSLDKINAYAGSAVPGIAQTAEVSSKLNDGIGKLQDKTDEVIDKYFSDTDSNLVQFIKSSDNPRIKASSGDQVINKYVGLVAGIIVIILFTYVLSVFVIHEIEKEKSVIGALYALGVTKKDLMIHYLTLPAIVTFISGIAGTLIGFSRWAINMQMADCYNYYSVPALNVLHPSYLIVYGVIMPPVVAVLVNLLVINKKLSSPVLQLLKNEQKNNRFSNIKLTKMSFINRFRIRQLLREARTGFTVVFGLLISLLIVMIGLNCYVMCNNVASQNKEDTKFKYMYNYKYPDEKAPSDGEACFTKSLSKEIYGYNLDVTLMGVNKDNPYFDVKDLDNEENSVIISSAVAYKYGLKENDAIVLTDNDENRDYSFKIKGITQYSTSLTVFMDIRSMRKLLDESDDYYNTVLSDKKLYIDSGKLYSTITKDDISKSSDIFINKMMPMVIMLIVVSVLIFCIVMYLMMKVMIERSSFSISLIKIFGYRDNEVKKIYLNSNFYIIAVGAAICIPIAKKIIDVLYPLFISNVPCGVNYDFPWQLYAVLYGSILVLYFMINKVLSSKLKKVVPAEVLKNRE